MNKPGNTVRERSLGPAALVTAAFIGPGTVTACTLAGAGYGYALLWALLFSIMATLILQEMSARLGLIARLDLGSALRLHAPPGIRRLLAIIIVISAIAIGNAAYETGNILGGSLGLDALVSHHNVSSAGSLRIMTLIIGLVAFILLYIGSYKVLERILVTLVILMSLTFVVTMVITGPNILLIIKGLFIPEIPKGAALTVAGLVGTTVVPYNLFLHSALVQERWHSQQDIGKSRKDLLISISLGGLISMAIVITASAAYHGSGSDIKNATDLAIQLEPLLGKWARWIMAIGLFSAGITSAITAPLAAAYATSGVLGWEKDLKSFRFRAVWIIILVIGLVFSLLGMKPLPAILFAQAANGILLPVVAVFLLMVMNNAKLLGTHKNKIWLNVAGIVVVLVAIFLGLKSIITLF